MVASRTIGRLAAGALFASAVACNASSSSMGSLAQLGGHVASGVIQGAASGAPRRRDTYEYRVAVARARGECAHPSGPMRVLVQGGAARLTASDRARVVRYVDCNVTWLDDCAVEAAYGAARPAEGDGSRSFYVWDEVDLFELVPAMSANWHADVARGSRLLVETRTVAVRQAPALQRANLPQEPGCTGATHWVRSFELGAMRVGIDIANDATERERDAQKAASLGDLGACRDDGAAGCDVPIAVDLQPL
ncbi:MAG: hypothetical protein JNL38_16630 [Myxococcales bacterium]|nr:hypothetical protein [Myxococcales bacterium]